ncbi:hypothetical protein K0819_08145 [Vibrio parahaemolyticus]|uniref:hypothetical protein n=1 Tax=Vibrio parahaemolyticus TaxID=670 RepID=UPI0018698A30|nr:hypothetical protein [Vibrio parahaemolyticus]MBE3884815.1 hypothetical protein [Vibrio parahaemolyticus]WCM66889.1 hypothetical protein K0819_08045 [Vibrio parahaemolyticus]WCM66891.1 hypothetical protein K0819_08055 [Vibrio parahaemolyticus]WCM66893.1 hypothetical protein K0819_08065 [Vibrio parahaemolyticus]WCM66895.1 hypothetical protein K0819_08075 [Vibrio parahaemolyticus]
MTLIINENASTVQFPSVVDHLSDENKSCEATSGNIDFSDGLDSNFNFRCNSSLKSEFKKLCKANQTSSTTVLKRYMLECVRSSNSDSLFSHLHQLCWELKELSVFLDSGVNLCESTESQLKEQRMQLIESLELFLSSPEAACQVLSRPQV